MSATTPLAILSRRPISMGGSRNRTIPPRAPPLFRISPCLGVSPVHVIGEELAKIDSKAPKHSGTLSSTPCQAPFDLQKIAQLLSFVISARLVRTYLYSKKIFFSPTVRLRTYLPENMSFTNCSPTHSSSQNYCIRQLFALSRHTLGDFLTKFQAFPLARG